MSGILNSYISNIFMHLIFSPFYAGDFPHLSLGVCFQFLNKQQRFQFIFTA